MSEWFASEVSRPGHSFEVHDASNLEASTPRKGYRHLAHLSRLRKQGPLLHHHLEHLDRLLHQPLPHPRRHILQTQLLHRY